MDRFGGSFAVLLISAFILQSAKAAEDAKGDRLVILAQLGDQRGQISNGDCKCKNQCEAGRRFSVEAEPLINVRENANRHSRAAQGARFGRPKGEI
jgi:hypothetical protein